jgi:hypothetical protein
VQSEKKSQKPQQQCSSPDCCAGPENSKVLFQFVMIITSSIKDESDPEAMRREAVR